jgi:hypothetical protein
MVQLDFVGVFSSAVGFRGRWRGRGVVCGRLCFTKKSAPVCAIYMNFVNFAR